MDSAGPSAGTAPRQPVSLLLSRPPTTSASLPVAATYSVSVFWPVTPSGQGVLVGCREGKLRARGPGRGEPQLG